MKINESISSRVFHFCPIQTIYSILEENVFKMTPTGTRNSDDRMSVFKGRKYPFYFCVTRNQYSGIGYASLCRDRGKGDWSKCMARIELDGDALNHNFAGGPVSAFIDPKGQNVGGSVAIKRVLLRYNNDAKAIRRYLYAAVGRA